MSTRWLVIVVVSVFVVVLSAALALTGGDKERAAAPAFSPTPAPATPASPAPSAALPGGSSPIPGATATGNPATAFSASGDLVAGWYWLRDAEHQAAGTWTFATLPFTGDIVLDLEVLATDATGDSRGQAARFFLAWAPVVPPDAAGWSGRLPVTLANVSRPDDPDGFTCRGSVTLPRSTLAEATTLAVRISRDDVRDELDPSDVHVAVDAASVRLRSP